MKATLFSTLLLSLVIGLPPRHVASAQAPAGPRTDAEIEAFLRDAKVVKTKSTSKGITNSLRATLSDGTFTHDAQIQSIDEQKAQFTGTQGTEFNFRDTWKFNVAAYRLDRLIGLNMVPVSIPRRFRTDAAAFTWWIDDVMMDEGERLKSKTPVPSIAEWNEQMQLVRVFDQLIYNVDRNMGNLLITKDWHIWAIDHTRAFRTQEALKSAANVTRCDRQLLERLKALDKATLKREMGEYLGDWEINSLLVRRDAIVARLEAIGASALFDRTIKGSAASEK
jgi:hypothetical protein